MASRLDEPAASVRNTALEHAFIVLAGAKVHDAEALGDILAKLAHIAISSQRGLLTSTASPVLRTWRPMPWSGALAHAACH